LRGLWIKAKLALSRRRNIERTPHRAILLSRHVFASTSCACDVRIGNKKDSA
jgi:hypothetical protein